MRVLNTVETFAGTGSFSKVARSLGHRTFTTDYEEIDGQDLVADVRDLTAKDFPYRPDVFWASPPCEGFSVAGMGKNWGGGRRAYIPKGESAFRSIELVNETKRLIAELEPTWWFIENPQGVLKNLDLLKDAPFMHTIWYCKYGDTRAKPTNIWTNAYWWKPKTVCRNYRYDKSGNIIDKHCHHESARRGARTGTQGIKGYKDRSRIPPALFEEIFKQHEAQRINV